MEYDYNIFLRGVVNFQKLGRRVTLELIISLRLRTWVVLSSVRWARQ